MSKSAKVPRKANRPPGRAPRRHIEITGDVLIPKTESPCALLTRMRVPSALIVGISYVASLSGSPKRRRARR
jgi:hypothetical protein